MNKLSIFYLTFLMFPLFSFAKGNVELMCRSKAKEIAITTYSSCITENKNRKIEKIRDSYKKELQALKNKYDKALKNLSDGSETTATVQKVKTLGKKQKEIETSSDIEVKTDSNMQENSNSENLDADEVIEVQDL